LYIEGSSPKLVHTTVVRNRGGSDDGVYVMAFGDHCSIYICFYSNVTMTNTILVSHTVGISVTSGNMATLESTLWGSGAWANGRDWTGTGTIVTGTHNYWGDPVFVDPTAGDYHLGSTSAAIDRGVDAGVTTDIDGQARPNGAAPDLGMDEYYFEPLTDIIISGPAQGAIGYAYTFTASPRPLTATIPITYTWDPAPMSGQGTAMVTYTWGVTGAQAITVTAVNAGSTVTGTHLVTIEPVRHIYLPLILSNR
jgi:hypothetical protein